MMDNRTRKNPFRGLGVAVATPFTSDGAVDVAALEGLIEHILAGAADFLCILGTTAETPTLSRDEQLLVRQTALRVAGGRVPLLLGAGGNSTAEVCARIASDDLSGFDGLLIVAPYYNKPTQEGLYAHFRSVSQASPLPLVLYNVPGRTGVNITASTTLRLARDCPNIVAIKEASGRIAQIEDIIQSAPAGFEVLSGDDAITFELFTLGAVGVISVLGNAYPRAFGEMVHTALRGDYTAALKVHRRFSELYKLLMTDGNPGGIKCLLAALGKAENVLRLPLVPVSPDTATKIQAFAHDFWTV